MRDASLDDCDQDSHQGGKYRRIELITGDSRRRRWTAEEKARIVAESLRPGTTVSEVALRHGLNRGLLWHWRRQLREHAGGEQPRFVPIRITEEPAVLVKAAVSGQQEGSVSPGDGRSGESLPSPAGGSIDIEFGDARVRISGSVEAAALRQVLMHFRRRP